MRGEERPGVGGGKVCEEKGEKEQEVGWHGDETEAGEVALRDGG